MISLVHNLMLMLRQAPDGESQPNTEVDLFISTEKIMVLNTDLKVIFPFLLYTVSNRLENREIKNNKFQMSRENVKILNLSIIFPAVVFYLIFI